jgi:hypothetical protein
VNLVKQSICDVFYYMRFCFFFFRRPSRGTRSTTTHFRSDDTRSSFLLFFPQKKTSPILCDPKIYPRRSHTHKCTHERHDEASCAGVVVATHSSSAATCVSLHRIQEPQKKDLILLCTLVTRRVTERERLLS